MTANKDFKRVVRQRAKKTGLSYAAARHILRRQEQEPMTVPTRDELYQTMSAMRVAIGEMLSPIAEAYEKPLDPGIISAVMFDRDEGEDGSRHWVVHLYSLSPGLVIGKEGRTATSLRDELCRLSGDDRLRLNIIDFAKVHQNRRLLTE